MKQYKYTLMLMFAGMLDGGRNRPINSESLDTHEMED